VLARYGFRLATAAAWLLIFTDVVSARRVIETANEFRFTGAMGSGYMIEVKGLIGDVVAEPSTGNQVEVLAVKRSQSGEPAKVRVELVHHERGATIEAVYPEMDSTSDSVHFRVRVPAGVRFVGRTANGRVAASGLRGPVEAQTVNGDIDIQTSGEARAETINGSIIARLDSVAAAVSLKTVNGNVTVKVPPCAQMEVEAHTTSGAVTASLPWARTDDALNHFSGVLGRGGSRLDLRTVNGDIFLQLLHR
jgi:hypothetical protein